MVEFHARDCEGIFEVLRVPVVNFHESLDRLVSEFESGRVKWFSVEHFDVSLDGQEEG